MRKNGLCSCLLAALVMVASAGPASGLEFGSSEETRYGAHFGADKWVDFIVYAPEATAVDLLLYSDPRARAPKHRVRMTRSGDDWKVRVRGANVGHGLFYMYQALSLIHISEPTRPY